MHGRHVALFVIMALAAGSADAKSSGLCRAIKAFERAPLSLGSDGQALPRSVELLWRGPLQFENAGSECRHHGEAAGRALCKAIAPPPQEFRKALPFAILRCYGYTFPAFVNYHWGPWESEIRLGSGLGARLRLDIVMTQQDNTRDALRMTVFPEKFEDFHQPLPSLREPIPHPDED